MNKKFSTLLACALVAGSFSFVTNATDEIPYRTQAVLSEQFDACLTGVKAINPDYYYQLQVNASGSGQAEGKFVEGDLAKAQVLVQVRDYQTGNLTLKVMDIEKAPLTGSLWRIEVKDKGLRGKEYVFVNRETGYTINYDCADAVTLTSANANVNDKDATIIKDDNLRWEWYSDDVSPAIFGPKKVWSYTHEGSMVMGLMANSSNDVVAVKINKDLLEDEMTNINFLTLTVRTAGAKVLTADDINSMIDAEGSWQNRDSKNEAIFKATGLINAPAAITGEDLVTGAYLAKEVADEVPAYANWDKVQPDGKFFGYNILLNKKTTDKYLMVATDETHESIQNPSLHGGLKVVDAPFARTTTHTAWACDALMARYIWKATYYATNDSLVLEPLNASVITTELKQQGKKWAQTKLYDATGDEYYNTVNAGTSTGNNVDLNGEFARKKENVPVALTAMNATSGIDSRTVITVGQPQNATTMGHLVVTSAGNAIVAAENHTNQPFCYPYANMNVKVNFNNTYLPILNRTTQATGIYYLQLSTTKTNSSLDEKRLNGSYLVADYAGHYRYDVWEAEQNFAHMPATQWVVEQLGCPEGGNRWVKITNREFASQAFMGQLYTAGKNAEGKELVYIINHNYQGLRGHNNVATPATNNALNCADTLIFAAVENPTIGYLNIADDVLRENKYAFNLIEKDFSNQFLSANDVIENLRLSTTATNFEFFRVAAPAFGYKVGGGTIGEKYLYKVKVSDANKIDNDHVWVAYDNNHKFVIASENDINAGIDGLKWATFAFKENSENEGVDCYTLVHHELATVDHDQTAYQPVGVLSKELQTAHTKAIDLCQREYDVFDIIPDARPLYMNMRGDAVVGDKYASYINSEENCMKFTHTKTAGNLFERSLLAEGLLNYLDIETLSDAGSRKNAALYVDEVAAAVDSRMPQYMFVIRPDSAVAYTWCSQHGINSTCEHSAPYKGYVAGEFLVNLNDSIHASINKLTDASKFHSDNYTRLAFVEAIHQGDFLYVLKAPYTIASISAADPATEKMYVVPTYLAADQEGIVYDKIALDGAHNNVAFAIRYVGDTEEDGIMLESYDVAMAEADKSEAGIGSFTGAWVTLNGTGVPVLGKFHNENGNHDTDDSVGGGNSAPVKDFSQVINQAAVFAPNATEGPATDTEEVEVATIKVISGNGSVTVIGAEGKTVTISNVLGQAIANTVVTSNEATISTPAGVVFVAVEGEAAVKAIVK